MGRRSKGRGIDIKRDSKREKDGERKKRRERKRVAG